MPALRFAVYPPDDPLGDALGELTDAMEKRVLVEDDGVGAGSFTLNRHSDQAAWCTPGAYVAAYRDTITDHDDALAAFWLEGASTTLVAPGEQGAEDIAFEGRGPIAILAEALTWHRSKRTGRRARRAVQPAKRRWHFDRAHPSRALIRLLEEARARGSLLEGVSRDFDRGDDSDGDNWHSEERQRLNVPIGINMLELVDMLRDTGLIVQMTPGLVLRAWDSHGDDLSSSITFAQGVNIRETGDREWAESRARSAILVEGENKQGRTRYRAFSDSGIAATLGRRKEGFYRVERTATRKVLRRVGRKRLNRWRREYETPAAFGVLEAPGSVALVDYHPGDTVTIDIPGEYDEQAIRIASVALIGTDTDEYDPVLEFGHFLSGRVRG